MLIAALSCAALPLSSAQARTIVECVEQDGSIFFSDRCPPGTVKKTERRYSIGGASTPTGTPSRPPVTLYTVAQCDACDLVRNALQTQNVPYTEKDVAESLDNQTELKTASGALNVPTVVVGQNVVSGYNRSALDSALAQAGYPQPPAPPQ